MKKIFGKNQVIITALAVMIAVAGYLSVTQEAAREVSNNNIGENTNADIEMNTDETMDTDGEIYDISEEDIQAVEDIQEVEEYRLSDTGEMIIPDETEIAETETENAVNETDVNTAGEAVLVSSTIGSQYFDAAKISREQTRSKNKEILMEIVESENTTEEQKEKAVGEVIELTADLEKETAAETMLEANGYGECIVNIVDGKADVIVNANNLSEKEIARIEDVVKRKTDIEAKDIVITPVGVTE